jgi:hypothetical protein
MPQPKPIDPATVEKIRRASESVEASLRPYPKDVYAWGRYYDAVRYVGFYLLHGHPSQADRALEELHGAAESMD